MNVFEVAAFAAKLAPLAQQAILVAETTVASFQPMAGKDGVTLSTGEQKLAEVLTVLKAEAAALAPDTPWADIVGFVTASVNSMVAAMNAFGKLLPHATPAPAPLQQAA